jgi:hypothetical protein
VFWLLKVLLLDVQEVRLVDLDESGDATLTGVAQGMVEGTLSVKSHTSRMIAFDLFINSADMREFAVLLRTADVVLDQHTFRHDPKNAATLLARLPNNAHMVVTTPRYGSRPDNFKVEGHLLKVQSARRVVCVRLFLTLVCVCVVCVVQDFGASSSTLQFNTDNRFVVHDDADDDDEQRRRGKQSHAAAHHAQLHHEAGSFRLIVFDDKAVFLIYFARFFSTEMNANLNANFALVDNNTIHFLNSVIIAVLLVLQHLSPFSLFIARAGQREITSMTTRDHLPSSLLLDSQLRISMRKQDGSGSIIIS